MKKTRLIAVAAAGLCLLRFGAVAQDKANEAVAPTAPRIVCAEPTFDFGTQDNAAPVVHDFVIRNDGTAPLKIGEVRSSCGCTVATLSSKLLPPGTETTLKATFDMRGRHGDQSKHISVESNDPVTPALQLWLKGMAVAELATEPQQVSFGGVNVGAAALRSVYVTSRRDDVTITNATCSLDAFTVTVWEPGDKRGLGLNVKLMPQPGVAYLRGEIKIETDHPRKQVLTLPVFAQIRGAVDVLPREMVLRKSMAGPQTRTIMLRPGTQKTFTVTRVECPVEGVQVEIKHQSTGNYHIVLRAIMVTDDLDGKEIKISTDLPRNGEFTVPFKVIP